MSERDDVPAGGESRSGEQEHLADDLPEGVLSTAPDMIGGASLMGSPGVAADRPNDSDLPTGPPDPSIGPD